MNHRPQYLKIILVALTALALTGCDNPFAANSSVWNTDVGELNNKIICDVTGIASQLAQDGGNTYPWLNTNLTDESQWIDVFFKTKRDGTPNSNDINQNTFRYFPLTDSNNPVNISPFRIDPAVMAFVDGSYYGDSRFGEVDDSDANDHTNDLMMIPLVGQDNQRMTEIQAPGVKELNGNTEYEIYTLDYSAYLDKQLSNFDPYKEISYKNFPAVIFVLYDPVKYASLPFAERVKLEKKDPNGNTYRLVGSAGHMYFKAYYSVYHFNQFFDRKTCQLKTGDDAYKMCAGNPAGSEQCQEITPPWQFGACVTETSTAADAVSGQKCVKAETPKSSLSDVISTEVAASANERRNPFAYLTLQTKGFLDSLRSLGMTKQAYAADSTASLTADTDTNDTKTTLWARFKSGVGNVWRKVTGFMHISADPETGEGLPGTATPLDTAISEVRSLIDTGKLKDAAAAMEQVRTLVSASGGDLANDIQRKIDELEARLKRGLNVDGDDKNDVYKKQIREVVDGQKLLQYLKLGGWTESTLAPRLHQQEYLNPTFPAAGCKSQCDTGKGSETETYDPFLPNGNTRATDMELVPNANNGVCGVPSSGDCLKGDLRCTVAGVSGKDSDERACGNNKWQTEGHICAADRTQGSCSNEPPGIGAGLTEVPLVKLMNLWFTTKIASRVSLLASNSNAWITQLSNSFLTNDYLIDTSATQYNLQSILSGMLQKYLQLPPGTQLIEPLNTSSNVGQNTILYDLATFVQNLWPSVPHNCTNDTSLDGNLPGQIQCAFAHSAYSTTVTQDDYETLGITREGTTDQQGFGLTDTLAQQQTKIDDIIKSIQQQLSSLSNSGVDDELESALQNVTDSETSSSGDTPASAITEGMAGYTPVSSVTTTTPSCWYTPDPFVRVNNE